jgi:hypothetical protein
VVAGPYSLCDLRETAAKAAVQNSNLIGKWSVRGIKNLCRKKGGTQNNSPLRASVLYSREGAGRRQDLIPFVN